MRNTNATIATMSRIHVTTRLLAGIIDVPSSYMPFKYCIITSSKARHFSVSRDLAEERTTCCGKQLDFATNIMLKKLFTTSTPSSIHCTV